MSSPALYITHEYIYFRIDILFEWIINTVQQLRLVFDLTTA